MKKTILAIATIITLTVGNSFAQRYRHEAPAINNSRGDNAVEEYNINKLDEIVKLSRKQENKIKKIENHYDQLMSNRRYSSFQNTQKLERSKQKDILEILTPAQRQRLFAYQNSFNKGRYNRRG
ncbi:hypothetical protein MUK70_17520 [Dyadobacter chenwenxiniae]|uniref:LTXXQ motif family protein n=1 Tax=Dyadobacter chenwenxiniae TaxID=2906456 RepID=A0A9X1PK72_9BACT|nr:hypothetical protein [Dyadobacter chenwenxiniae]MCF0061038.1 hypothetical protein [Dyadobacter chenwenxiniae]UON80866.1 hypothetical protein MUK70_17520 [Dyadobacter chenwenxiniae]